MTESDHADGNRRPAPVADGRGESVRVRARGALIRVPESAIIIIVYLAAHGVMFFNRGLYWDDWVWYRQSTAELARAGSEMGGSLWPVEISMWTNVSPLSVWITRGLCAALVLVAFLAFAAVLKSVRPMDGQDRLLAVVVATTFPVFAARVPLSDATYIVCLCLFMVGWWLASRWADSKRFWLAAAAALLFFLSFQTESLIVFYLLVLLFLLYRRRDKKGFKLADLVGFAKESGLFFVPPVLYLLLVKVILPAPSGPYQDYNKVTALSLAHAGWITPTVALVGSFLKPLLLALSSLALYAAVVFAILVVVIASRESHRPVCLRAGLALLGAGFLALCLAVFPYVAVGKMPTLAGFESRHQLLVPFGAALMLVYAVRLVFSRFKYGGWMSLAVILVIVAGSVAADVGKELEYYREMYKADSMVQQIRELPQFEAGTAFLFDDHTPDLDVSGRGAWRFYEFSGIFADVFGDQTRFGADAAGWRGFEELQRLGQTRGVSYLTQRYKLSQYRMREPQYRVAVTRGKPDLRRFDVLARLIWLELTDRSAFEREVSRTVELKVSPYTRP